MGALTLSFFSLGAVLGPLAPSAAAPATDPVNLSLAVDLPLAGASALLFAGSLVEAQLRQPTLCPCDPGGLPGFDRVALSLHSGAAGTASDVLVTSLALLAPAAVIAGAAPFGWTRVGELATIQAQSMALSFSLGEAVKYAVARPRPYAYPSHLTDSAAYVSFWSGHSAASFNAVVTGALLLHETYPNAAWPWIAGGAGLVAATATAALRVEAGVHFPSDVVSGALVGSGIGVLVPLLHLRHLPVQPTAAPGGAGVSGVF